MLKQQMLNLRITYQSTFNVTLRQEGFLNTTAKGEITKGVGAGSRYGKMTTLSTVENVKSYSGKRQK